MKHGTAKRTYNTFVLQFHDETEKNQKLMIFSQGAKREYWEEMS